MRRVVGLVNAAVLVLIPVSGWAQQAEPIRRGWNSMNGVPYNSCNWLIVSGPEAAKRNLITQAKKAYIEPEPARMAAVEGKVFIEILTNPERGPCSNRTMTEIIFVEKKSDKPALRLPLESKESALSNGFGATWTADDGLATADLARFKTALATGDFHVVIVYQDGETRRIGQGAGGTVWSGKETNKVR